MSLDTKSNIRYCAADQRDMRAHFVYFGDPSNYHSVKNVEGESKAVLITMPYVLYKPLVYFTLTTHTHTHTHRHIHLRGHTKAHSTPVTQTTHKLQ